ncbi:MAG: Branched-chain amino acid transport ATP-binding protein LivG, partial [uncultured Ramlibacter sp.]
GAVRGRRPVQALRRHRGARRHHALGRTRRAGRDHGPERGRQDHLLQCLDRPVPAGPRPGDVRRRGHHRAGAARDCAQGHFEVVPDHEPVQRLLGPGQRAGGDAAGAAAGLQCLARPGCGCRRPGPGCRGARARGPGGQGECARQEPVLRRAARARDRRGAGGRAPHAVPRRAYGGARCRGHGEAGGPDPAAQAAAHHRDHRARHAVPVPAGRPGVRDPLGPGDRARHPGTVARERVGATLQPREPGGM